MLWLAVVSYGIAALAYSAAGAIVIAGHWSSRRGQLFAVALLLSGAWGGGLALASATAPALPVVVTALDVVHLFAWTLCVLSRLEPSIARKWLLISSAATGLAAIAGSTSQSLLSSSVWVAYPALVLMALIAFLAVEQVYRNAREDAQRHLKLFCLGTGGIVACDLFLYSHAALFGGHEPLFWTIRGFVNTALLPLIMVGVTKKAGWERELYVSRHVMFYTASVLGVGAYLLAMGAVAYLLRASGQGWSFPLNLMFLIAAIGLLISMLFSSTIRAHIKAFLIKHFYRNKYDYREEWLRLTQTLSRTGDLQESATNGLRGMARIIGSQSGYLWLEKDEQRYEWVVSLSADPPSTRYFERAHALVAFLSSTGWVIDSDEYAHEPSRYGTAFGHPDENLLPKNALVVPLERQGYLQGFVVLGKPAGLPSLNFEDHDILKTIGRQVAAVLAQALGQEKLSETRQFEATSRLTAFLMHDLKNIVAQQELVVANAQRFRHRPDFIDDAFATIRGGTDRIKKVLEQLANASRKKPAPGRVDVSKVLMEVRSQCADRQPIPEIEMQFQPAWVRMDHQELASVLLHLVRNAQDASPAHGRIRLVLSRLDHEIVVTVSDTGVGMDPVFIRDRLFRPFDSTKGAAGMGIGAFQARHIVRLAGGELDVSSQPGAGTTFAVKLPAAA